MEQNNHPSNAPKIITQWCRQHLEEENCDSFLIPMSDGKFVVVGTLEGIRALVETEGA